MGFGQWYWRKNYIFFCIGNSDSRYTENKDKDSIALRVIPSEVEDIQGKPEVRYNTNTFRENLKICLSLHYKHHNSYLYLD